MGLIVAPNGEAIDAPNARQSSAETPLARRPGTQGKQSEGAKWASLSSRTAMQSTRQMRDNHQLALINVQCQVAVGVAVETCKYSEQLITLAGNRVCSCTSKR